MLDYKSIITFSLYIPPSILFNNKAQIKSSYLSLSLSTFAITYSLNTFFHSTPSIMAVTTFTATSTAPRVRPPGCTKLDGVAMWVINGITGAFFASLERCSCIRISTYEDDFGDEEANPLIFNDGDFRGDHEGRIRRRRIGKGKKARAFVED